MRTTTSPKVTVHADGRNTTTYVVQRCCNGCGRGIGDIKDTELDCAITGRPLPDVRHECPWCAIFLSEVTDA